MHLNLKDEANDILMIQPLPKVHAKVVTMYIVYACTYVYVYK